jgi:hypothetical protein
MVNMLEKGDDNLIEVEEFFRILKNCIFYKRDYRRLNEIFRHNFINSEKINKNNLIEYLHENDEIIDIFQRNYSNIDDVESYYNEEINMMCSNNLKKSKLTYFENLNFCENDNKKFENIMETIRRVKLRLFIFIFIYFFNIFVNNLLSVLMKEK